MAGRNETKGFVRKKSEGFLCVWPLLLFPVCCGIEQFLRDGYGNGLEADKALCCREMKKTEEKERPLSRLEIFLRRRHPASAADAAESPIGVDVVEVDAVVAAKAHSPDVCFIL